MRPMETGCHSLGLRTSMPTNKPLNLLLYSGNNAVFACQKQWLSGQPKLWLTVGGA